MIDNKRFISTEQTSGIYFFDKLSVKPSQLLINIEFKKKI